MFQPTILEVKKFEDCFDDRLDKRDLFVVNEVVMDCTGCKAKHCCKDFYVPLTPAEVNRLKTDQDDRDFIMLKKKPNGECFYLTEEGCSIWTERPTVCREYCCIGDKRLNQPSHIASFKRRKDL